MKKPAGARGASAKGILGAGDEHASAACLAEDALQRFATARGGLLFVFNARSRSPVDSEADFLRGNLRYLKMLGTPSAL